MWRIASRPAPSAPGSAAGPLRVLLVTPGFAPQRGGVEQHTTQLATALSAAGVHVEVLTARRGLTRPRTEHHHGIRVRVLPAWRTTSLSLSPRLALASLRASRTVDLVHAHSYHASSGLAAFAGARTPVVLTPHYHGGGHSPLAVALHRMYRRVGTALFRSADTVICVSQAEARALTRDFPATATRIRVLPNGVDRTGIDAAQPYPDQPPTVLVLGRLEPYKGVDTLIRAVPDLTPSAQVVIIGDGSHRTALAALAGQVGVAGRVRFLGGLDTPSVHRWLRTARVLVSLSDHEAFGMAPLEAGCAGARLVLSDIPAHREIAADYLGAAARLVPADPVSVADAVNAQLDPTDRVEIDAPDWTAIAQETLTIYHSLHTDRPYARRRGVTP